MFSLLPGAVARLGALVVCVGALSLVPQAAPQAAEAPAPVPVTSAGAPYCMFDAELPEHITVAGPRGGVITVNGEDRGTLVEVTADDEVAGESDPYNGLLYNVEGPGEVAVDGIVCETT